MAMGRDDVLTLRKLLSNSTWVAFFVTCLVPVLFRQHIASTGLKVALQLEGRLLTNHGRGSVAGQGFNVTNERSLSSIAWYARDWHSSAALPNATGWPVPTLVREHDCDSILDPYKDLIDSEKRFASLLIIGLQVALVISLVMLGFVVGRHLKPRPPKYWKSRQRHFFHDDYDNQVDVTESLGLAIQRLLNATTKPNSMGRGRDGSWATHKAFKVVKVTRIEHGKLWTRYKQFRTRMRKTATTLGSMQPNLRKRTEDSMNKIERTHLERQLDPVVASFLRTLKLDTQKNEVLLFHGCPGAGAKDEHGNVLFHKETESPMWAILRQGFDDRLGNVKGMYGAGTYFADMSSKADQYAGRYNVGAAAGSVGEKATMFLARVALGVPYLTNQSLEQLQRPPCTDGHFDLKLSWNEDVLLGTPWKEKGVEFKICDHPRFDSVVGDLVIEGKRKLYREYVVYHRQQCYPEFCVEYERLA